MFSGVTKSLGRNPFPFYSAQSSTTCYSLRYGLSNMWNTGSEESQVFVRNSFQGKGKSEITWTAVRSSPTQAFVMQHFSLIAPIAHCGEMWFQVGETLQCFKTEHFKTENWWTVGRYGWTYCIYEVVSTDTSLFSPCTHVMRLYVNVDIDW